MDAADHVAAATTTDLAAVVVVEEGRVGTMDIALEVEVEAEGEAQVSVIAAVSMDIWPGIVNGRGVVAAAVVREVVPVALSVGGLVTSLEIARVFVPVAVAVAVVIRVGSMGIWQGIVRTEVLVAAVEGVVVPGGLEAVEVNASAVGMKDILLENALTTHENNSNKFYYMN